MFPYLMKKIGIDKGQEISKYIDKYNLALSLLLCGSKGLHMLFWQSWTNVLPVMSVGAIIINILLRFLEEEALVGLHRKQVAYEAGPCSFVTLGPLQHHFKRLTVRFASFYA